MLNSYKIVIIHNLKCIDVYGTMVVDYTPFVPKYKTLSINSCSLRKVVNLVNHIKFVN